MMAILTTNSSTIVGSDGKHS